MAKNSILLAILIVFSYPFVSASKDLLGLNHTPPELLSPCRDANGRLADVEKPANLSDSYRSGDVTPHSRLLLVCKYPDNSWYIECEKGGYSPIYLKISGRLDSSGKWKIEVKRDIPLKNCPKDNP